MTSRFFSLHRQGFVRVAACTPRIAVGDPARNAVETLELLREGAARSVDLMLFPELGLSAYAIDDLFLQDALLDGVERAIGELVQASRELPCVFAVGAPVRYNHRLFNCAVVIARGRIAGVTPKSFLPNYREYYEHRWFAPGVGITGREVTLAGQTAPFGTDLLFASTGLADFVFHVEICEDVWAPAPPSIAGAAILCNLSASNVVIGKAAERAALCISQSMRCQAAYVYSAAGPGESTTDLAWDGQATIHELGVELARTERFPANRQMAVADVDVQRIRLERLRTPTFHAAAAAAGHPETSFRRVCFEHAVSGRNVGLVRPMDRFPFVPDDPAKLDLDCYEAFNIQIQGLRKRLEATNGERIVIGVSGGLDSTHALIVAARTFDALELPRSNILAFTMPGFATSDKTKGNAWALMKALGVTAEEIDIKPAARQMLADLGHPFSRGEAVYDVTFENVQAGLRTDYLFRLANQRRAFVLGTGDLSELALGWCTYGVGDQMSHYNVNAGVPKTLIQHLIRWAMDSGQFDDTANQVLGEILDQEITPELIPTVEGQRAQATEDTVGPYALQDFTLYHVLRRGYRPSKIAFLAWHAWHDASAGGWPPGFPADRRPAYQLGEIRHWLEVFCHRFFASQFKRGALPNGPKVSAGGTMSPRGDWRMPSDAAATTWLADLANVPGV